MWYRPNRGGFSEALWTALALLGGLAELVTAFESIRHSFM